MECVPDSKAWKHIDSIFHEFASEEKNIRLGLALDGVNPSNWLVVLVNYNLPPWLVTNRYFVMYSLIILGKESVILKNIDVYLAPLIEELLEL
jgi:hypothetical protein